jgi:hypothetical protein
MGVFIAASSVAPQEQLRALYSRHGITAAYRIAAQPRAAII